MAWDNHPNRRPLPANWGQIRRATEVAAGGRCEWVGPPLHPAHSAVDTRCTQPGTDADHVVHRASGADEGITQWLCDWHHKHKTAGESAAARRATLAKLRHPTERPPGLR